MVSTTTLALFSGAFTLQNISRTQYGTEIPDSTYGTQPAGVIQYTTSNFYMSAVLTTTDPSLRPLDLTLPAQANQTDAEWADVGRHTLAYSGPFYFNESLGFENGGRKGQVIHGPLYTSTLPSFVGSLQHRNFTFVEQEDDTLYLNLIGDLGHGIIDDLWWKRVERNVIICDAKA